MKRFLLVLGSNWHLSLAEIDLILRNPPFKGRIIDYSANITIVEIEEGLNPKTYVNNLELLQFYLGGILKIAEILDFIDISKVKSAFPELVVSYKKIKPFRTNISKKLNDLLPKVFPKIENENIFFAVSIYPNLYIDDYYKSILVKHFLPFLNENFSRLLKERNARKAIFYKYPQRNMETGNLNPIFPHHVIRYNLLEENRAEIIFGFTEEGCYIARTYTVTNPNFQKKIDEKRPFTSFERSIPPKFAKIMLNFLNLYENKESKRILDPFCGSGTILIFAYINGFEVYGADIKNKYVEHTIKNLRWVGKILEEENIPNFKERIKNIDIKDLINIFEQSSFDGICTEPIFGPFYKQKPDFKDAKTLLDTKIRPTFEELIKIAYKLLKPGKRLCLTSPVIETVENLEVQLPLQKIAEKHKLNLIPIFKKNRIFSKSNKLLQLNLNSLKSIIESKKNQIIKRKFYLFQKLDNNK